MQNRVAAERMHRLLHTCKLGKLAGKTGVKHILRSSCVRRPLRRDAECGYNERTVTTALRDFLASALPAEQRKKVTDEFERDLAEE